MDGNQLKARLILKGLKVDDFLEKVSKYKRIDKNRYYRVLRGEDEFDRGEIVAITKALNLSEDELMDIFFNEEVS